MDAPILPYSCDLPRGAPNRLLRTIGILALVHSLLTLALVLLNLGELPFLFGFHEGPTFMLLGCYVEVRPGLYVLAIVAQYLTQIAAAILILLAASRWQQRPWAMLARLVLLVQLIILGSDLAGSVRDPSWFGVPLWQVLSQPRLLPIPPMLGIAALIVVLDLITLLRLPRHLRALPVPHLR